MIKFIPYPVTTGFTAGIAVIIFSGQMKEFFGLNIPGKVPADFVEQWSTYFLAARNFGVNYYSAGIALGSLLLMALLRKLAPKIPHYIVALTLATAVVALFHFDDYHGVQT